MVPYSVTVSSPGEIETAIGFLSVENRGTNPLVVIQSMEGAGGSADRDQVSLSSSGVMTASGEKSCLIVMISCVDNGGCTKEGVILSLGWAVGPDVGIRQGCGSGRAISAHIAIIFISFEASMKG